jgi:type I restriction enzyme S subunit
LAAFAPATAQSNINLAILGKLAVALPPVEEQREIIRRVGDAYARCASAEAAIRNTSLSLDQIARSVLASAFRGEQ